MTPWTVHRIVVAVDDSPAAMAAVRTALAIATGTGAHIRFVHVLSDGELVRALTAGKAEGPLRERRTRASSALLEHVVRLSRTEGVEADGVSLQGEPAQQILAQASAWPADLLVIGRSDVRGTGRPYVGTVTRHVLEFADDPVLVVPRPE